MSENNRILIIDDDLSIWKSYESVLNKRTAGEADNSPLESLLLQNNPQQKNTGRYQLNFAQQGKEGYEILKQANQEGTPFAVAFIDMRMPPGWNGVETACAIREIDPDIEIVIITAYADVTRSEMVDAIGSPDKLLYLRKPFDTEELSQIALQLTEKRHLADQQKLQQIRIQKLLEEISNTRDYMDRIINNLPFMLVGVNASGEVTLWNQAAESITGHRHVDTLLHPVSRFFPGVPDLDREITSALDHGRHIRMEKIILKLSGKDVLCDIMLYPFKSEDNPGVVIRIEDITERTKLQDIMVQSDKMLTVGGLAAGMAHEINTPLGSIIQSAQVIANRIDKENRKNREVAASCGTDIEAIHRYMEERGIYQLLEGIRDGGGRTSKIVKSMLSFSHKGDTAIQQRVNETIDEALELSRSDYDLKKLYRFNDIHITRDYADNLPPINIDRTKFEQVIMNLIRNAAQAMMDMGRDHHPTLKISTSAEKNHVVIRLEDNGPGIDRETQKRIFDPFFTTKEIGIGTGLGLSLAYFIITNQHGGEISVESAPGEGAVFTIKLPVS